MPKKGGFVDLTTMVSAGVGAYAAKGSKNMSGLLLTLAKYVLVIVAIVLAVRIVVRLLGMEMFSVPVKPSPEGDKKEVTPAGNVILY
jgi:hypothetical protein